MKNNNLKHLNCILFTAISGTVVEHYLTYGKIQNNFAKEKCK